ncbi:hypothetical protein V6N13_124430 [Hibiscus sabdariffa]
MAPNPAFADALINWEPGDVGRFSLSSAYGVWLGQQVGEDHFYGMSYYSLKLVQMYMIEFVNLRCFGAAISRFVVQLADVLSLLVLRLAN